MFKTKDIKDISSLLEAKKTLIFDFDGTIADTESFHWEAYHHCLSEFDVVLTKKHIDRYIGNTESKIYRMIKEDFDIDFDEEVFLKKRISIFLELIKHKDLKPFKFFMDILNTYSDRKFNILSSQKEYIITTLLKLWDLESYFDNIISVEKGDISKAAVLKDTYKYFGAYNNEVVLFEDTNRNLTLAKNESIVAIGVEHNFNKSLLKDCDAILSDAV